MSIKAEDNITLESKKPIYDIAANTDQYFWRTETGTDTGAHITEIPKEDFLDDPANGGGNLLARSNGIAVRDGLTELTRFGADGIQVGKDDEQNVKITPSSFEIRDSEGGVPFSLTAADELTTKSYAWIMYTSANTGRQTLLVTQGSVVDGRYYISVGTSEPPYSTQYYIENPIKDEYKTISIDNVNISLKKISDNVVQAIVWNHNASIRYTRIQVQMSYLDSTAVINQRLMKVLSHEVAIEDVVGTHTYGYVFTYGNMAQIQINCQRGSSVANGGWVYEGKLLECIPTGNVSLVGFKSTPNGNFPVVGYLSLSGEIYVWNTTGVSLSSPAEVSVYATYIIREGSIY